MYKIGYYRTWSHPEIWDELLNETFDSERYELVEKPDYKKKRLVREISITKQNIESYKKYLSKSEENLKRLNKELKELG